MGWPEQGKNGEVFWKMDYESSLEKQNPKEWAT